MNKPNGMFLRGLFSSTSIENYPPVTTDRVARRRDLSQTDKNYQVFGQSEQQLQVRKACESTQHFSLS